MKISLLFNLLVGVRRLGEVERSALVRGQRDAGYVRSEVQQEGVQSRAESDGRDDTETDPVDDEERVLPDPLDVHLMLAGDVPEGEEGDEDERHQSDGFLVVQKASLVQLKERRGLEDAILDGEDRMRPQFDVLALFSQSLLFRGVASAAARRQRSIWR